jgi:hypothetical protein
VQVHSVAASQLPSIPLYVRLLLTERGLVTGLQSFMGDIALGSSHWLAERETASRSTAFNCN